MRVSVARWMWGWRLSLRQRTVMLWLMHASAARGGDFTIAEIGRGAGVNMHPTTETLTRLERLGWVSSLVEERTDGRPHQRTYLLTESGVARVTELLGLARERTRQ